MFGHKKAKWNNFRCGSHFTAKVDNTSLYGYIEKFVEVTCHFSGKSTGFAFVSWFAPPTYPDHDPLTVEIDLQGEPAKGPNMLYLDEIDPARIMFLVNRERSCMNVMRIEGIDVSPDLRL